VHSLPSVVKALHTSRCRLRYWLYSSIREERSARRCALRSSLCSAYYVRVCVHRMLCRERLKGC
jgi:hypothetical protein